MDMSCDFPQANMGAEVSSFTFTFLLDFLIGKYKSDEAVVSQDNAPPTHHLPSTLSELHNQYDMVVSTQGPSPVARAISAEHVQMRQIVDLIVAVLSLEGGSGGEASMDKYRIFKLFESFPEVGVV